MGQYYHPLVLFQGALSMDLFFVVKSLHVLSAVVLVNVRFCVAFWFWSWHRKSDKPENLITFKSIATVERLLAAPIWATQLLSGIVMLYLTGYDWLDTWLILSYTAFVIALLAGLATLRLSLRLSKLLPTGSSLPASQRGLIRRGLWLSGLSLFAVAATFWLMIAKSQLSSI
jgi:uncharacterized membrane protein